MFFHISPNPNIRRLMPRRPFDTRPEEVELSPVVCAAKSIAACVALTGEHSGDVYVYVCEDDGKWTAANYDHPEAEMEYRRSTPCNVIQIGCIRKKSSKYKAFKRAKDASKKRRTIKAHETDIAKDFDLLIHRRWI